MKKRVKGRFPGTAIGGFSLGLWAMTFAACSGSPAAPQKPPENPIGANLTQISSDPYTIGPGQHATEVEPHVLANQNTLVAAFQTGRIEPVDIGEHVSIAITYCRRERTRLEMDPGSIRVFRGEKYNAGPGLVKIPAQQPGPFLAFLKLG